jgi:hypothetical protein
VGRIARAVVTADGWTVLPARPAIEASALETSAVVLSVLSTEVTSASGALRRWSKTCSCCWRLFRSTSSWCFNAMVVVSSAFADMYSQVTLCFSHRLHAGRLPSHCGGLTWCQGGMNTKHGQQENLRRPLRPDSCCRLHEPLFSFSWVTARVRACGVNLGQLSAVVVKWIEQSLPWHDAVVVFSLRESPKRWDVQQPGLEFPGPVAPRLTPALLGDGVDAGAHIAFSELCAQKLCAVGDSPQNRPGAAV